MTSPRLQRLRDARQPPGADSNVSDGQVRERFAIAFDPTAQIAGTGGPVAAYHRCVTHDRSTRPTPSSAELVITASLPNAAG
jgi:hypothetical protein